MRQNGVFWRWHCAIWRSDFMNDFGRDPELSVLWVRRKVRHCCHHKNAKKKVQLYSILIFTLRCYVDNQCERDCFRKFSRYYQLHVMWIGKAEFFSGVLELPFGSVVPHFDFDFYYLFITFLCLILCIGCLTFFNPSN